MANPNEGSLQDLKKVARYLKLRPSLALVFKQQAFPRSIDVFVDSDFAACRATRKSTTGMVMKLGGATVKTTSNMQTSVGLNVSECEFYALCHGAAHGLGMQAYLRDLGYNLE
eukprot:6482542-Amphidinium_carterae.1